MMILYRHLRGVGVLQLYWEDVNTAFSVMYYIILKISYVISVLCSIIIIIIIIVMCHNYDHLSLS